MTKAIKINRHHPSALQGSLNFNGGRSLSLSVEHPVEQLLFRVIAVFVTILLFAYLYFVFTSVLNVIARKEAIRTMASLQTSISDMEQRYFTLSHSLSPDSGSSLGLMPIQKTSYVYKPGNTASALIEVGRE